MTMTVPPSHTSQYRVDDQQLGHIRHIDAMSRQLPNDWSGMGGKLTSQDDFGGYRFQLAYAAYALALAHRHRLPNAPGVFQPAFQRLIDKMLLPEVWMYWRDVSRGGAYANAHLVDNLSEQWNPVVRDNIMYSAYVQSLATMYNVLFDDDKYTAPGSLSFEHWSFFWGGEPKRFEYDQNSLTDHLYWRMVETGYLGIACEPNCVFQICNQPAIIGFRMHDILTGGHLAADAIAGYQQAWKDYGRLDAGGHYVMMILEDSKVLLPNAARIPWVDAWCGALMNTWNREFVREHYPSQVADFIVPGRDGALSVASPEMVDPSGRTVDADTCDFGWVAVWASEMGDETTLDGLLTHADRYMHPTWRAGALFYPRNDTPTDDDGNMTIVEPLTGNSLLAYARLNVPDGMWGIFNEPWDSTHFAEPLISEVSDAVDITAARFNRGTRELSVTASVRTGFRTEDAHFDVANVGDFSLTIDAHAATGGPSWRVDDRLRVACPPGGPHDIVLTVSDWTPM